MSSRRRTRYHEQHASQRALERFGFLPDLQRVKRQIRRRRAQFHHRKSRRLTVWIVGLENGAQAKVFYDSQAQCVATLMRWKT